MEKQITTIATIVTLLGLSTVFLSSSVHPVIADPKPTPTTGPTATPTPTIAQLKVNICHKDGQSGNYSSITININSVTDCTGAAGHDGHSGDIIPSYTYGSCTYPGKNTSQVSWISNNCSQPASPTATPTPTGVQPTATPTPTGTVTITDTPTPTPTTTTTSNGGGDNGDGLGCAVHDCSTHPATTQAVLGASTMASTGTFEENAMNVAALLGVILMSSSVLYKKFSTKFSPLASKIA